MSTSGTGKTPASRAYVSAEEPPTRGPTPVGVRRRGRTRARWRPYLFLLPALGVIGALIVYPIGLNLYLSLASVRTIMASDPNFVGFDNYARILTSDIFWNSLRVSAIFTVGSVFIAFVVGFTIALALNRVGRGRPVFLALLLIPWVISPVVTAYAWRWLFNDQFGLVNHFLQTWGLIESYIPWLAQPRTALAAVIVANAWRFVPFMMLMMLAGLQAIPRVLYEAADVDGAGPWQKFRYITVGQLRYITGVVLLFGLIWTFNDFAIPFIMTEGGPARATNVLPILVYRTAFESLRFGAAAAFAVVVLVVLLVITIPYVRRLTREGWSAQS